MVPIQRKVYPEVWELCTQEPGVEEWKTRSIFRGGKGEVG